MALFKSSPRDLAMRIYLELYPSCGSGDNSPLDNSSTHLVPNRSTIPRTSYHKDYSPLGPLSIRNTCQDQYLHGGLYWYIFVWAFIKIYVYCFFKSEGVGGGGGVEL